MNRTSTLLLLAALVLLGLRARLSTPEGPPPDVPLLQPGSIEAEQDAWRLRLVELAIASGRAAGQDRFLDAPEGRAVPWPPLFPALLARIASLTTLRDRDMLERGRLEDREVLELTARLLPILGGLAVVGAFLAGRALHGGAAADLAGLCAAACWALIPSVEFAESAGRVDPQALSALLAFTLVAATSFALRAREEVDATLGGLVAGVTAGLGLACASDLVLILLACLIAFGIAATQNRPGARRALILLVVAGAVATSMALGREETNWVALLPTRVGWGATDQPLRHWPVVGLGCAALVSLAASWRHRARLATAALLIAGLAWAAAFDPAAAGVAVALVLSAAVATADLAERIRPPWKALAPLGLALVLLPSLGFRPPDPLRPGEDTERTAWRAGLRWMRSQDPSGDPWNHPAARPDGWILTAPTFATSVAVGTRRAVLSAAPPGLHGNSIRATQAARLLAGPADPAQIEALRVLGVRRVVVGPAMAADPWLVRALAESGGGTLFEALTQGTAVPEGIERLWPGPAGSASLSIWRVGGERSTGPPTSVRPR